MKVVKGSIEMKLAAVFVFFAAALLLSANVTSRLNLGRIGDGVSVAHAEDEPEPSAGTAVVNGDTPIVNEAPVSGDMAQ